MSYLSAVAGGVRIRLHVQPNARRTEIVGLHGEALKIKLNAVPEDGKANAELERFLAELLGLSRSQVSVVSGQTSRQKVVEASAVSLADAQDRLGF